MTKRTLILSDQDRAFLLELIEQAQKSWRTYAPHLNMFRAEVIGATIVPRLELPCDRVMIGDCVCLLHARSSMRERVQLVMPYAAAVGKDELSILSPLGAALLGARCGERVQWLLDDGPRQALVEDIVRNRTSPRDVAGLSSPCSK
jgi:regulator of nucleoside diphosphate kinase